MKNRKKSSLLIILLTIALIIFSSCGGNIGAPNKSSYNNDYGDGNKEIAKENTDQELAIGKIAPDFTLKNLEGEKVSLADFRGKIILLNFWATWCGYCKKEMPDLQKLAKKNDDVVVLAVNVEENPKIVKKYINENKYTFPVLLDEDGKIAGTYLVGAYPTSYFIDKEGILLGGVPGMLDYSQMLKILSDIRENKI